MNEEAKQLLRQEFIKTIIEDEDSFEDTNAGFRKFLKRKGAPVFNYKKGGKVAKEERSKAEEPLSNYESYSENELLSSLDAKMPNLQIVDDELVTMPKFKPLDVLPPNAMPVMPSLEQLINALYMEPIGIKDGGYISKGKKVNTDLTTTIPPISGPNPQGIRSLFKQRKRYADGGYTMDDLLKQSEMYSTQRSQYKPFYSNTYDDYNKDYWLYNDPLEFFNRPYYTNEENLQKYTSSIDKTLNPNFSFNNIQNPGLINVLKDKINFENMGKNPEEQILNSIKYKIDKAFTPENTYGAPGYKPYGVDTYFARDPNMELMGSQGSIYSNLYDKDSKIVNEPLAFSIRDSLLKAQNELPNQKDFFSPYISKLENDLISLKNLNLNQAPIGNSQGTPFTNQSQVDPFSNIPQVDPFTGDLTTQQDKLEFQMPQDMFPQQLQNDNVPNTLNLGSLDPTLQALGKSVGSLDYSDMNALRNNKSLSDYFTPIAGAAYGKTAFDAFNQIGLTPAKQSLVNQALNSSSGIANALLGEVGGGFRPTPGGVGLGEYIGQGLRSLGQAATLNTANLGVNPAVGGGTLGSRVLGNLIGGPAMFATALLNPTTMGNAELTPQMRAQQANMADGGLTRTIPPVRGPIPQGVETLFKRR